MKKQLLLLLLISLFMTSSSYASYLQEGNLSCGTIISNDKKNSDISEYYILGWVRGYITARNYENSNISNHVDADSIKYSVLKYCNDNPLKDLDSAVFNIYSQIK